MPRHSSAVPKYRRHKASGQAVVTIAGRDPYLGPLGTKVSKAEYDRLVGEWLTAGRPTGVPVASESLITVTEIIAAFWHHAKQHFRKNGRPTGTHENCRPVLSLLRRRYGHTRACDFGPLALKALRREIERQTLGQLQRQC